MTKKEKFLLRNSGAVLHRYHRTKRRLRLMDPPAAVQWIATNRCNLRCRHCLSSSGVADADELSTSEALDLVKEFADLPVGLLSVTGGEPLLREDVFEVLGRARSLGLQTSINTNGALVKTFERELCDAHLVSVNVSIDGLRNTHNSIRCSETSFDEAVEAMEILSSMGVIVSAVTTINRDNCAELNELFHIVATTGAVAWQLQATVPGGRAAANKRWCLAPGEWAGVRKFVAAKRRCFNVFLASGVAWCGPDAPEVKDSPFFCAAGITTCTVAADGSVIGCFGWPKHMSEGNVRERSFADIWYNEFDRFRNAQYSEQCRGCGDFNVCHGGCSVARYYDSQCLKYAWTEKATVTLPGLIQEAEL